MLNRNGIFYTDFRGRDGKKVRLSTKTGMRAEASRIAKELEDQYWQGTLPVKGSEKPKGMTLEEGFQKAFRTCWRGLRCAKTYDTDSRTIMEILGGSFLLTDISAKVVTDTREKLYAKGYKTATVNNKLACLSSMLAAAKDEWEVIDKKPLFGIESPRNKRMRIISRAEEIKALSLAEDSFMRDLLVVLMDTGMRLGEALKLTYHDIQIDDRTIRVVDPKVDGEDRGVPMTDKVMEVFSNQERINQCFSGRTRSVIDKDWDKIRSKMGLEGDPQFVLHLYRHTCATRLLAAGVSIYTVKAWLGHKSIETTMRYAKMTTGQLEEARKALDSGANKAELKLITKSQKAV